ncbi:RNA-directed DNA polymerase [Tuberibacillus calidus]|uniref:RNA-directed DNA polymerase n=1 Tax=Tuberibacillus calidus TaxID=340097 RepID=UPI0009D775FF|nr:RNA-directed DNA polymerase [Tuberibacillus calidus]
MNIDIEEQLIKYGYISEHIPSCFNTELLYKHYQSLKASTKLTHSEPLSLTISKNDGFRRTIKIPNPEQQIKLFDYIISNVEEIKDILENNKHTLSNPFKNRFLNYDEFDFFDIPNFKEKHNLGSDYIQNMVKKVKDSMGYKYVYKLDLANFYDNIYTHTLEWAIIGKEAAKENFAKKTFKNNLGEKLDRLVRNTNNKETAGIPTGPFSSRILSELLLNRIDHEIEKLMDDVDFKFLHYVDDYEFYFRNEADFNIIRNKLRQVFEKYRLKINESKTQFMVYPYHHNTDLKFEFKTQIDKFRNSKKIQDAMLIFFKADELYEIGEKGAYKYLYKQLKDEDFSSAWKEIESFFIGHLLVKPSLAPYIIKLIINHKNLITDEFINELKINIKTSVENGLDNEAEWLFWILTKLNVKFNVKEMVYLLEKTHDDLLRIMLIDYIHKWNKIKSKKIRLALDNLINTLSNYNLRSEHWLIIYEWVYHKWHNYNRLENKINEIDFFKALKKRNVSFYNPYYKNN